MIIEREDEKWQAYVCADCDPTLPSADEDNEWSKPYVLCVPEGETWPDNCPRCGSYLSFVESAKGITVSRD